MTPTDKMEALDRGGSIMSIRMKMRGQHVATKYVLLGLFAVLISSPISAQRDPKRPVDPCIAGTATPQDPPVLNTIQSAILGPSYSCGGNPAQGYGTTALFLSEYSRKENSPELLFNGACGSPDYFDVNTNGDAMSLIADLGSAPLVAVTSQRTFNLQGVNSFADYTQFALIAPIVQGHTYAVVINHSDVRGLFLFTVVKLVSDQEVDLQFELKDYQINLGPLVRSPGFDWSK
jgi:hypothetical protein